MKSTALFRNAVLVAASLSVNLAFAHETKVTNQKLDLNHLKVIEEDVETESTKIMAPDEELLFERFRRQVDAAWAKLGETEETGEPEFYSL